MTYDFVIIGTGPSGSILASNLAKKGFKIAMIDRATNIKKKSKKNSFIYSPYINKTPFNYTPLFSNQLGGNSALWNNKIYLLTKEEFKTEDWQFSYEELRKNSLQLSKILKIKHNLINNSLKGEKFNYSKSLRANKLGNLYEYLKIDSYSNITVYTHSSPVKLNIDKNNKINEIVIKNIKTDNELKLKISKSIIFCAGGLGNPNIIQNLFKKHNKNTGKKLCDHPHINLGKFKSSMIKDSLNFGKYFLKKNKKVENNLFLQNNMQFAGAQLDYLGDPSRIIKKIYCQINRLIPNFLLPILIKYYSLFDKILNKLFFIFDFKGKFSFEFFFSQIKSKRNSILINKNFKDVFGNFKSDIKWVISKKNINFYNNFISRLIGRNGQLIKNKNKYHFSNNILAGLHPSCTTEISNDKLNGCVDKNLKLHDSRNAYVCGSSVFKLNGFTNPTWTIMTLANRLSKHLSR